VQKQKKSKKTDMLRRTVNSMGNTSIVKPEGEKGKAAVGRICRKGRI